MKKILLSIMAISSVLGMNRNEDSSSYNSKRYSSRMNHKPTDIKMFGSDKKLSVALAKKLGLLREKEKEKSVKPVANNITFNKIKNQKKERTLQTFQHNKVNQHLKHEVAKVSSKESAYSTKEKHLKYKESLNAEWLELHNRNLIQELDSKNGILNELKKENEIFKNHNNALQEYLKKQNNQQAEIDNLYTQMEKSEFFHNMTNEDRNRLSEALELESYRNDRLTGDLICLEELNGTLRNELNEVYSTLSAKENLIRELYNHISLLKQENQILNHQIHLIEKEFDHQKEKLIEQHHYEMEMQNINFNENLETLNAEHEYQVQLLMKELHQTREALESLAPNK